MPIVLFILIAGLWAAFLLPSFFDHRSQNPRSTTKDFARTRQLLAAVSASVPDGEEYVRRHSQVRRTRVLLGLGIAAFTTLVVTFIYATYFTQAIAEDANAYYYANEHFHQLIYQACGNAFLVQQTQLLKNRLKPYRRLQLQLRNRMSQSLQEHRDIVRALQQGDEEAAAQAARDHVLIQGQRFTDLMSLASQPLAPSARPMRIEPLQILGA